MKRFLWIVAVTVIMIGVNFNFAGAVELSDLKISGDITVIAKSQDSYKTILADETAEVYEREGSNYRNNQHFRARASVVLSIGDPGKDKWFGATKLKFDANDPDVGDGPGATEVNSSENDLSMDYTFIMYRPFEAQGGRPFGVMAGVIPFKATANAAYFHYFQGDFEDDFIFYTVAAIMEVPGIGFDFHISEDTGFGIGYANGVDDASEIGALMTKDSVDNIVLWGEAKKWGFGWNGAMQMVKGERSASKVETTDMGNTYNEFDKDSSHTLINTQLTYTFDLDSIKIMPVIAYQSLTGEEAPDLAVGDEARDIKLTAFGYGFKLFTNWFGVPGEFAIIYEDIETDEADGVDVLQDGFMGVGTGVSEGVSALLGVDWDLHAEYICKAMDNLELGLFYYHLESQEDDTLISLQAPYEWTDTTSIGLFAKLSF